MPKLRFLREEKAFIFDVFKVMIQGAGRANSKRFEPVWPVEAIPQANTKIKCVMISRKDIFRFFALGKI